MSSNKKIRVEKREQEHPEFRHETVQEVEERELKRAVKIVAITCAFVFAFLLSIGVGGALALWDMEKTPQDLWGAITGRDVASADGLTFYDEEDTALTFIDPESEDEAVAMAAAEGVDGNVDNAEDNSGDSEGSDLKQAGDILDDGTLVVSSELAGITSIARAGSEEAMRTTSMSHANVVDPNALYPLPFEKVDESYFEDALFIGDSRLQGFGMWSGLPGTYYCATGFQLYDYKTKKIVQTGNGKVPIFSAIPYNAFTKIYIKVGINEMGWGTEEGFEEVYAQLIADLRAVEPRAIIYIHAVLPVTAAKSASDKSHNNPNIIKRNTALQQFAINQKAYFIDAAPAVSDETGCLRPETTSDGIHLSSKYMGLWKQYLLDNAVVVPEE